MRFSPDGAYLAAIGEGDLSLWSVETGKRLWSMPSSGDCLAFSPDGSYLAAGGDGLELWDIASGKVTPIKDPRDTDDSSAAMESMAFSPDGTRLVGSAPFGPTLVWDTRAWKRIAAPRDLEGASISLSGDGRLLAAGSTLYDLPTLHKKKELEDTLGDCFVHCCMLSPDGRLLLAHTARLASYCDEHMVMWDTVTGKELGQLDHNALCATAAFSPNGSLIATGCRDNTVKLWNTRRKLLRVLECHEGPVNSVVFSPDGRLLASGSEDGTVKLWDVATILRRSSPPPDPRGRRSVLSQEYKIEPMDLSRDTRVLLSHDVVSEKVWSAVTGRMLHDEGSHHWSSALSADGRLLATFEEDGVALWRTSTWKRIHTFPFKGDPVERLRFTPDGSALHISEESGEAHWWDLHRNRLMGRSQSSILEHSTFSADGKTSIYKDGAGRITVWQTKNGSPVRHLAGRFRGAASLILSPRGDLLAAEWPRGLIQVWDLRTGLRRCSLEVSTTEDSLPAAFSPDGRWLTTYSQQSIQVWETQTGRSHRVLKPYAGTLEAATFSNDSRILAAGAENGSVQLWNLKSGARIHTFTGPGLPVKILSFAPHHQLVAVGSSHVRMALWRCRLEL